MKVKKRIIIVSIFFLLVVATAICSVAMVFALPEQTMNSNVSINFKTNNVAGSVNVKYKNGEGTSVDIGTVTFDGSEVSDNEESLQVWEILQFDYDSPYIVFEYTFTNIGQNGYWATLSIAEDLSVNNLIDAYSINNVSYGSLNNGVFVSGAKDINTPTTQKYYVKISVKDLFQDANATLHFNCELSSLDSDYSESGNTVFVGNASGITTYSSLKEAVNTAAAGETIIINSADAINLTETLTINKNLTIISYNDIEITNSANSNTIEITNGAVVNFGFEGYGKITITANTSQSNLIQVTNGELTLGNVDLVGLAEETAVSTTSVSAMSTTSVTRAVYVESNSTFTMNGGSIKNFTSTQTIHGMAIYIKGETTLNGLQIENCNTGGEGGAIYIDCGSIIIKDSTISECGTSSVGGVARIINGNATIINSNISNCYASEGAVMRLDSGTLTIKDSVLNNNHSAGVGGALGLHNTKCEIENSELSYNKADTYGGAIYQGEGNSLTITNSKFIENSSANFGGAIITLDGSTLNIKSGIFTQNTTQTEGGVVWLRDATLNLTGGTFKNNSSVNSGGCIGTTGTVTLNINEIDSSLVMDGNDSSSHGAESIYCSTYTTLNLTGGTFKNHLTGYVIYLQNETSTINANFYDNNFAIYNSGSVLNLSGTYIGNSRVLYNQSNSVTSLNANIDCNKLDGTAPTTKISSIYMDAGTLNINGGVH